MDSTGGGGGPLQSLSPESIAVLGEGISLLLSRWTALQMAVQNGWGGRDSRRKADEFTAAILSWFSQSKAPLYIDDLENILDENMVLSFNAEIEDGSIEEVAEQLMIMHEDCLQGNYESIEKLRQSDPANSVSQSKRVIDENEDESSDEEASDMMVDEIEPKQIPIDKTKTKDVPDEEGWYVVPTKRNKGKKSK